MSYFYLYTRAKTRHLIMDFIVSVGVFLFSFSVLCVWVCDARVYVLGGNLPEVWRDQCIRVLHLV